MASQSFIDQLFLLGVKQRKLILFLFHLSTVALLFAVFISTFFILTNHPLARLTGELAGKSGEFAILSYVATLLPGIFRRLRIQNKLVSLLMIYRRQVGILTFYLLLLHFWLERGISWFLQGQLWSEKALFELFGIAAFLIFFLLYVTSNDYSTKKLGVWWTRMHNLTYILVWITYLHVALNEFSMWALILMIFAVLELGSHLYSRVKK